MSTVDNAIQTQLDNIQEKTGKTLTELFAVISASGIAKHGEIVRLLKTELGMGHGDANRIALDYLHSKDEVSADTTEVDSEDVVRSFYAGAKADLLPIHERFMAAIAGIGPFEVSPKKNYVSLRRKKQFAMIGPATKMRVEVGLNMKDVAPTDRLIALPPGGMCQYKVYLTDPAMVDDELLGWIEQAYTAAG